MISTQIKRPIGLEKVTIAEEQKLNRAAEKLFGTPSALTQQVANLEREIGAPLFYRSRNGWTPTEAGNVYLKSAREILQIHHETGDGTAGS